MQMPSPTCEVEGGGLAGFPFDSTGTFDSNHKGQQNALYLTRGLPNPACRRTATAVLLRVALAQKHSAPIAITTKIIWSILSSSSLLTVPLIHCVTRLCCAPRRQAPPGCREGPILPQWETPCGVSAPTLRGKRIRPPYLYCAHPLHRNTTSSTSVGPGPRDHGHSESLSHGSAERIRLAREPSS